MQKTVYTCDDCDKVIGERKHISLNIGGNYSGIAVPNKPLPAADPDLTRWEVKSKLNGKFLHFCNGQCIGRFFSKLLKKY